MRPARQDTPPKRHLITPVPGQSESRSLGRGHTPGVLGKGEPAFRPRPHIGFNGFRRPFGSLKEIPCPPEPRLSHPLTTCAMIYLIIGFKPTHFLNPVSFYAIIPEKLPVWCASHIFSKTHIAIESFKVLCSARPQAESLTEGTPPDGLRKPRPVSHGPYASKGKDWSLASWSGLVRGGSLTLALFPRQSWRFLPAACERLLRGGR